MEQKIIDFDGNEMLVLGSDTLANGKTIYHVQKSQWITAVSSDSLYEEDGVLHANRLVIDTTKLQLNSLDDKSYKEPKGRGEGGKRTVSKPATEGNSGNFENAMSYEQYKAVKLELPDDF